MYRAVALVIALFCLLGGCSGLKPYRSDAEKNLFVTTDTDDGWFSGVDAALDIYSMPNGCDTEYLGTVNLPDSLVEVGVSPGVPAYLVFRFESSAFLTNTYRSMGYDVTFYPEYGYVYDVDVSYYDNIYDVEVAERTRGGTDSQLLAVGMAERDCGGESTWKRP